MTVYLTGDPSDKEQIQKLADELRQQGKVVEISPILQAAGVR